MAAPTEPGKQKPHPIVELAFACVVPSAPGSAERLRLDPDKAAASLGAAFRALPTPEERDTALVELVAWARFMDLTGSPGIAPALRDALLPVLRAEHQGLDLAAPASDSAREARRFLGLDGPTRAPPAAGGAGGKKWWETR